MRLRRLALPTLVTTLAMLASAPVTATGAPGGIVDIPLTLAVKNVNNSSAPCQPDGLDYRVAGHLVAPASVLSSPHQQAVTVYVHGSGAGSFWHFRAVPGVDYAAEMARLGHASVVIDMLGYGASDIPNGNNICFGSQADIIHQIIGKLRAGTYQAGPSPTPSFQRVALAGHSGGGFIDELEAYSFRDIDALVIAGWVDHPVNPTLGIAVTRFGATCATGGEPKRPGAASGYAFGFNADEIRQHLFFNAEPDVVEAYVRAYERDFCFGSSATQTLLANQALVPTISVPVLLVYGDHDIYSSDQAALQRARYQGSGDVTLSVIAASGHSLTLQRTAAQFRGVMHGWLSARGF